MHACAFEPERRGIDERRAGYDTDPCPDSTPRSSGKTSGAKLRVCWQSIAHSTPLQLPYLPHRKREQQIVARHGRTRTRRKVHLMFVWLAQKFAQNNVRSMLHKSSATLVVTLCDLH